MKQSSKINYIFNVGYQAFAILVPLITTPYISRVLGDEGIGTYSYTYTIVRYFWLLSALGISIYGTKNIGVLQESREKRSKLFWDIFSLKLILSTIFITLYYCYCFFIADNRLIAVVQGIYLLAVLFDISWYFQGIEDFKKISIRNFIIKVISVIFIFAFVRKKDDLVTYIIGLAAFQFLGNLSLWVKLNKHIQKVPLKTLNPFKCLKPSLLLFIPSIATQIFAILDKSMIGWFTNSMAENGYYEQAFKIVDMAMVFITTLGTVMMPKVSHEFSKGNTGLVSKHLNNSFKFVFFISLPMCTGINIIASIFVPWFFSEEYMRSISILQILSFLFIFIGITSVTGQQYLIPTNQAKKHISALLCGGCVNVIVNLFCIPIVGGNGAALGSVAGETIIAILELGYLQLTKQYNFLTLVKSIYKFILATLIMISCGLFTKHFAGNGFVSLALITIVCVISYLLSLMALKEEFLINEIKAIKKRIKKS